MDDSLRFLGLETDHLVKDVQQSLTDYCKFEPDLQLPLTMALSFEIVSREGTKMRINEVLDIKGM